MLNTGPKYNGEPTPHALANGLATLGRYGDSYMVHAAEGEAVIPREILEANPGLKEDLFRQMRMMGIQNPNRYVVGSGFNSINPITGQPEFFFKKIFRAVKKVFKKALPLVAPIIGNILAPGIGGLIASGLATKLQGGSWGDVLKSVGTTWVGGSLMKGLGGLGRGDFFGEFSKGMTEPFQAGAGLLGIGEAASPLRQGILGSKGLGSLKDWDFRGGMKYDPGGMKYDPGENLLTESQLLAKGIDTEGSLEQAIGQSPEGATFTRESINAPFLSDAVPASKTSIVPVTEVPGSEGMPNPNNVPPGGIYKHGKDYYEVTDSSWTGKKEWRKVVRGLDKNTGEITYTPAEYTIGEKITDPFGKGAGLYGKTAAAVLPSAYSYWRAWKDQRGNDDLPESATSKQQAAYAKFLALPDDQKRGPRGRELLIESGVVPGASAEQIARTAGITGTQASDYLKSKYRTAAEGGLASFLQGGGEVIGPGTGTSDSIPARLSNGEFVMTEAAVRGAGGGNRDMGAARMYDLMSRFEGAVA